MSHKPGESFVTIAAHFTGGNLMVKKGCNTCKLQPVSV